jgi:hypothetical protein
LRILVQIVHKKKVVTNRTDSVYLTKGAGNESETKGTIMLVISAAAQRI